MTQWQIGMRCAHWKTGHSGVVLVVGREGWNEGKMFIIWEEKHWTTRRLWASWRWCAAFRKLPPLTPMPDRAPPALEDLNEPN